MGFLYKTAFWLGLVYYAMPLGQPADWKPQPAAAALCDSAGAAVQRKLAALAPDYRDMAALSCSVLSAPPVRAPAPSAQTLTDNDKAPPWRDPVRPGPPLPPVRPRAS